MVLLMRNVRNLYHRLPSARLLSSAHHPHSNDSEVFVSGFLLLLSVLFMIIPIEVSKIANFSSFFTLSVQLSYLTEDKHQGIAIIGLNKPQTRNAFSRSMIGNLSNAIDVLVHDKSVRVIIIRSMLSDVFCSGADLKERITLTTDELKRYGTKLRALFKSIEQLPVPVLSAIDGAAMGGGLEMALACDIRTVSNDAKLGERWKFAEIFEKDLKFQFGNFSFRIS